jgi:hypothetical protein
VELNKVNLYKCVHNHHQSRIVHHLMLPSCRTVQRQLHTCTRRRRGRSWLWSALRGRERGLDQSSKEPKATFADEGKHLSINLILFKIYANIYVMFVHLHFRSSNETLDAWSLGTYALLLACWVDSFHALRTWHKLSDVRHWWDMGSYVGIIRFDKLIGSCGKSMGFGLQ